VFDPSSKSQASDVRIWCEWFCQNANLESKQAVIFANGSLTARHKPLKCRAGKQQLEVPIVNVNCDKKSGDTTGDTSANREFEDFMVQVFPFAEKAQ
jgi:hypothetical protein